jgi:hypothetical protein
MKPVNNKSLTAFLFDQMEKLDNGTIDENKAMAQVAISKQINSQMRYELERARVLMQLSAHNAIYKDGTNLREIESKNFEPVSN